MHARSQPLLRTHTVLRADTDLPDTHGLAPARRAEQRIRDLFTRNGIAPVQDDRGDRELILMYPLPDSAQRIASLCSEVLASGYGVADDEPLLFTLIQYP